MLKEVYLFSGLGADHTLFSHLNLRECNMVKVPWIKPEENESLRSYAQRLCMQIKEKKPVLIGLSFGGMVAVEVAKLIETEKVILISSAKRSYEIPFYYRWAQWLLPPALLTSSIFKRAGIFTCWLFGAESKEEKALLKRTLQQTDPHFLKWAVKRITSFDNETELHNLIHIHGSADRVLPAYFIRNKVVIKNGSHLMIINRAAEIAELIHRFLFAADGKS